MSDFRDPHYTGKKHPKGLTVLFFTEMWERFGFYLMIGIFSLYMLDNAENGGMGFEPGKKSDIYGTYIGLVYLTPFIGGLLADRILGYRRSIIIGGILMALGYYGLGISNSTAVFFPSLLLIILGNGFFKPNISTLVGNMYNDERYKVNKDSGYNIFYMGINIGSFFCNFVAAFLRNEYGWGSAFIAAGVGMTIGIIIFVMGTRHVEYADKIKPTGPKDLSLTRIFSMVLLPVFGFGIIGYIIKGTTGPLNPNGNIFGSDSNDAFLFGCIPVIIFYVSLLVRAEEEDKKPVGALLSVFFGVIVFWAVFHQNGDALTVFAEEYTNRTLSVAEKEGEKAILREQVSYPANAQKLNKFENDKLIHSLKKEIAPRQRILDSVQNVYGGSVLAVLSKDAPLITTHLAFIGEKKAILGPQQSWSYFSNMPVANRPPPEKSLLLISTELFQSINPFWVVVLTPVIVGLFGLLRRRKREPSTPAKIAIGLFVTGLSTLVMVAAVSSVDLHNEKASAWWLVMSYAVITVGELCLSPMGLSLVSKLSPPRLTALMMGGWFLSTSVGNKLSGIMSSLWEDMDNKANFFWINFAACMGAALFLFVQLRWLNKVMKEKGVN
ncbi:MAG TPA: peptide MFS transporter [Flavobacteriales bacterium]|nr:peptide MFS transporter [Flavobacteriales bacterium]